MRNAAESELVRLSPEELALLNAFRECNEDRQDALLHIAQELHKLEIADRKPVVVGNVILLTGRPLRA